LSSANTSNDLAGKLTLENTKLKGENEDLKNQLSASSKTSEELKEELDHLVAHYEQDQKKFDNEVNENKAKNQIIRELESKIAELEARVSALTEQINASLAG